MTPPSTSGSGCGRRVGATPGRSAIPSDETAPPALSSLSVPGTYVLVLEAPSAGEVMVGKLGRLELDGGWLLYVGSAFGPGGLRARLGHHLRSAKTLHWHIDHLLGRIPVSEVWWTTDSGRREEAWAEVLGACPEARIPLRGFGAGDCGCEGHLFRFPDRPEPTLLGSVAQEDDYTIRRAGASELASG